MKSEAISLEQALNALDVEDQRVEAEPLIAACFEVGFFPWDNPKFQVFLHSYLLACLSYRGDRTFMRGLICARHIAPLIPPSADADIAADICAWANFTATAALPAISCTWPAVSDVRLFWLRFWRQCDRQQSRLLNLRLKQSRLTQAPMERLGDG